MSDADLNSKDKDCSICGKPTDGYIIKSTVNKTGLSNEFYTCSATCLEELIRRLGSETLVNSTVTIVK